MVGRGRDITDCFCQNWEELVIPAISCLEKRKWEAPVGTRE